MKHLLFSTAIAVLLISGVKAQVTQAVNTPSLTNYVGFNNTSTIPLPIENRGFREINISSNSHNKFAITELPTWNGLNGLSRSNVQRTTLGLHGETQLAWSMLHLVDNAAGILPASLQRSWMNVGTSYTSNIDFMYTGLLERPGPESGGRRTDAVIAWGCQDDVTGADNFRIVFLQPLGFSGPEGSTQGRETLRITPWGNVGMGFNFSNTVRPWRRLNVDQDTDSAQFRISFKPSNVEGLGTHAEFQVSKDGNLHIKPRNNGSARATAIGFLNGEASPPYQSGAISTRLDVGGLTRIRLLPENSTPKSLITGYNIQGANNGVSDKFLGRIDFPGDTCLVLNGEGKWTNICNLNTGGDMDWDTDGNNVWTGTGINGYPAGKVGIGIAGYSAGAKLDVFSYEHNFSVGSIGIKAVVYSQNPANYVNYGRWTEVGGGVSANYGNYTLMNDGNTGVNIGNQLLIVANGSALNVGSQIAVGGASSGSTSQNYGILATSTSSFQNAALNNFGVYARACGATNNYAIYGETCSSSTGGANWAGYFNGDVYTTGVYSISDESIKEDIQEIPNASEILNSLNPKSFYFQDNESLTLSSTKQYGLIAQELETVLPELVKNSVLPLQIDSLGNITREDLTIKSVRYNDLIAILIAGFQEQNAGVTDQAALITNQNNQIAELEAQLETQANQFQEMQNQMAEMLESVQAMQAKTANCCNCPTKGSTGSIAPNGSKEIQLGQNIPNPFDNQTRIEFSLPESAAVILEITDEVGRPLERLIDAHMTEGGHSAIWDGSGFAPGVYFYTLYANGQLLTKKMIKH